jgi:hypothetical protein
MNESRSAAQLVGCGVHLNRCLWNQARSDLNAGDQLGTTRPARSLPLRTRRIVQNDQRVPTSCRDAYSTVLGVKRLTPVRERARTGQRKALGWGRVRVVSAERMPAVAGPSRRSPSARGYRHPRPSAARPASAPSPAEHLGVREQLLRDRLHFCCRGDNPAEPGSTG